MYDVLRVRTARRTEMLSLLAGSIPSVDEKMRRGETYCTDATIDPHTQQSTS